MPMPAVDLDDIVLARSDASDYTEYYVDTETGKVVPLSDELLSSEYREIVDQVESEEMDIDDVREVIDAHVDHDWMVSSLLQKYRIRTDSGDRYVHVPFEGSREGYRDIQRFITTVDNEHLRQLLEVASDGKGAFRRFKDVLSDHPQERQRWFEFSQERKLRRAREWLEGRGFRVEEEGERSDD